MQNNTTKTNDVPVEEDFQNEKEEFEQIAEITQFYVKFGKLNFINRKRILNTIRQVRSESSNKDWVEVSIQTESIFLDKHIKLVIASVREKYKITKKPTEKDFYRICAGENITIVNTLPDVKSKPLRKIGCYFTAPDDRFFLSFDEREKGKIRLKSQFQMLGLHFLHRGELPTAKDAFVSGVAETQRSNALLFALYFVDAKTSEVKDAIKSLSKTPMSEMSEEQFRVLEKLSYCKDGITVMPAPFSGNVNGIVYKLEIGKAYDVGILYNGKLRRAERNFTVKALLAAIKFDMLKKIELKNTGKGFTGAIIFAEKQEAKNVK